MLGQYYVDSSEAYTTSSGTDTTELVLERIRQIIRNAGLEGASGVRTVVSNKTVPAEDALFAGANFTFDYSSSASRRKLAVKAESALAWALQKARVNVRPRRRDRLRVLQSDEAVVVEEETQPRDSNDDLVDTSQCTSGQVILITISIVMVNKTLRDTMLDALKDAQEPVYDDNGQFAVPCGEPVVTLSRQVLEEPYQLTRIVIDRETVSLIGVLLALGSFLGCVFVGCCCMGCVPLAAECEDCREERPTVWWTLWEYLGCRPVLWPNRQTYRQFNNKTGRIKPLPLSPFGYNYYAKK